MSFAYHVQSMPHATFPYTCAGGASCMATVVSRNRRDCLLLCSTSGQLACHYRHALCTVHCSPVAAGMHFHFGCACLLLHNAFRHGNYCLRASALTVTHALDCLPSCILLPAHRHQHRSMTVQGSRRSAKWLWVSGSTASQSFLFQCLRNHPAPAIPTYATGYTNLAQPSSARQWTTATSAKA